MLKFLNNRAVLLAFLVVLAVMPLISSKTFMATLIQIFIIAVYAMSYDLLLGYTGIVSFGHAMFFGIGAYSVAIMSDKLDDPNMVVPGILIGLIISVLLSVAIGFLSLRVREVYFSMITLAVAELLFIVAEKWTRVTGGNDGMSFSIPEFLRDRTVMYYAALLFLVCMYLFLKRVVDSPLGKTLQAIRENEQRVESLGYNVLGFKVVSIVISGAVATLAGVMFGLFQRFVNTSVLGLDKTIEALLATIIGGAGTLIGSVLGAGVIRFAQDWLTSLTKVHPIFERWMIIFGILYILIVMFFPKGIVGTIREKFMTNRGNGDALRAGERNQTSL
ncbi:branched-chain amino acid ABC transporter permease [Effusibacillus lacus]|uniref:Branched-chain amino acid ABC transporter permease n=1 Tax=Effusibacillus lacus TaxID=1348429 RepID=A0A292YHY7_9BACL|nr:branched-chain amino acid ABC transporter permease [Effusibacillus lacus]TCS73661.1 amino acid/amide ABC transporter membrane protein 2 (HAAT family) [Effusibacillus lacus]GAX89448.1 branched-chain amino acid ABC transporter permease [Effusibacillus lacus]